jgi:hypothetical protein
MFAGVVSGSWFQIYSKSLAIKKYSIFQSIIQKSIRKACEKRRAAYMVLT